MDRLRQLALAQKAKLMDTLSAATPQSLLQSIIEGDKNVTRVVISGESSERDDSAGAVNEAGNDSATGGNGLYSTEMVCAILKAVEESKIVTHLTITNRSDASEFISSLTPAISKNLVLKYLKIDSVDIGNDLSMALFGALSKNTCIETVIVSNIGLTEVAGVSLFLKHAHAVKVFDVSGNHFGTDAFSAFADGLRLVSSSELKEIRLADTNITEHALNRICSVLEESSDFCPSLRVLEYGRGTSSGESASQSSATVSDAMRSRVIRLIDTRIAKAAESFRGGAKGSDKASDRMSASELMSAVVSGVSGVVMGAGSKGGGPSSSSTTTPSTVVSGAIDTQSTHLEEEEEKEKDSTIAEALNDDEGGGSKATYNDAASARPASPHIAPSNQSSSAPSSSHGTITEADVAKAVAAAVAKLNKEHAFKTEKLAELLGDSQAQALRLQEELHLRDDKIADLQGGASAMKEASRAMHQQFQQRIGEAEGVATTQLKEAADVIMALQEKLKEVNAAAVRQQTFFEETLEAERAKIAALEEENRVLRGEYLTELKAAIEAQRAAIESAQNAPASIRENAETQTERDDGFGEGNSASSPQRAGLLRFSSAANLITAAAAAAAKSASPRPSAAAYEDAVSGFALVDAEEAEEDLATSRWKKDEDVSHCTDCCKEFTTLTRRKHHCRRCGSIFCSDCIVKSKVDGQVVCSNCSRSETVINANNAKK